MLIKSLFLIFFGISAGMLVSGGVFTVLISVGLIPRFAGKTHTAHKIFLYEEMVVFGTIFGMLLSVFPDYLTVGRWVLEREIMHPQIWEKIGNFFLSLYGMFGGIFVGCLALAIAEMLDTIPIFTRRIGLRKGLGVVVLAMAIGKMVGSMLYFIFGIFNTAL